MQLRHRIFLATALGVLGLGAEAHADDAPLPGYGPTSIAIPVELTQRATPAPRLVRAAPVAYAPSAYAPPVYAAAPLRAGYEIQRDPWRPRGPVEVHDQWILAQPRMTLPAVSPDALPVRTWSLGLHVDRGSDFGWDQSGPAESPTDRRFIVDGEHQATELRVRYGAHANFGVGVRIPVYWRGGGFMDEPIDWFHEAFAGIGFLDNGRPSFDKDQYRVNGRDDAGNTFSWDDKRGTALGNIELEAYWHFRRPCCRSDWRGAVIARVALPTGGEPYHSGLDLGAQFVAAKQLGSRFDFYAGFGGTWSAEDEINGVFYESFRGQAFAAIEYAILRRWSVIVESNFATRLVTNIARYPAESWYINVSTRFDISSCVEIYAGFTENLADQQGTIDFGAFAGLIWRL
ncbi:MAG: DUF3187 family protein [Planctomycetota bacterium]|nr:DUF3187 family protein [Planctomycetota bacterium]